MFDIESMIEKAAANVKRDENGNYVSSINPQRLQATVERLDQLIVAEEELARHFTAQAEKQERQTRVSGIAAVMTTGTEIPVIAPRTARFRR